MSWAPPNALHLTAGDGKLRPAAGERACSADNGWNEGG